MRGLLSIVVVAAALTFVGASRAAVGQSSNQPATLTIVTVPKLAGVHLAFDGRTYVTGRQGKSGSRRLAASTCCRSSTRA